MKTGSDRFVKSNTDRMLSGICGGLGSYLGVDANIVRAGFIILALCGGIGIILYIAAMVIVPRDTLRTEDIRPQRDYVRLGGILLILIGSLVFLGNLDMLDWFDAHLSWRYLVPALLIIVGAWLLLDYREKIARGDDEKQERVRTFYRSLRDKKILGVCGGLGEYFEVDSNIIRLLWILLLLTSLGLALIVYFVLGILLPREPFPHTSTEGGDA